MTDLLEQDMKISDVVRWTGALLAFFLVLVGGLWNLSSRLTRIEANQESYKLELLHLEEYLKIPPLNTPHSYNDRDPNLSKRENPLDATLPPQYNPRR